MRIPSLDGIRAIAASFVIIGHLGNDYSIQNPFDIEGLGVRIFFVLSGFLITGLLLREHDQTGTISLQQFYFRRTLRIFPAFYAYLAIMLLVAALGWSPLTLAGALPAITYTSNLWTMGPLGGYAVSHTWSLSLEEQFYLIWPVLLLLSGRRLAPYVLLTLVLSSPILRATIYLHTRQPSDLGSTFLNLDHIGMGCLLAFFRDPLHRNRAYLAVLRSPAFLLVPALIFCAAAQGNHPSIHRTLGLFLINVSIVLCIDWAVTFPKGLIGRELNRNWIVWLGTLSYSIYLWQQPFTHLHSDTPALLIQIGPITAFSCIFACACLSHYFVERPFLRLRDRPPRRPVYGTTP